MTTDSDRRSALGGLRERVRRARDSGAITMLLLGVLAGASLAFVGESTVSIPLLGPVAGWLVGAVGIAATAAIYRVTNAGCDCAGDCDGSCSG